MTGFRKRMAQGLVATTLLCAVEFMVCGSWSAPGNTWERVCIVLVFVMLASMIGALALVAATYVKFRGELARHGGLGQWHLRHHLPDECPEGEPHRCLLKPSRARGTS
jgi:hypothetical protein